jgi:hypothetical protein
MHVEALMFEAALQNGNSWGKFLAFGTHVGWVFDYMEIKYFPVISALVV